MENKRSHNGPHNTFIFGVLVGVLIALLFTTKKGRKLLKVITEEGVDKLSHWEDIVDNVEKKVNKVKKSVNEARESVKEELYQDEVYEDESVLGEGELEEDAIEEEIEGVEEGVEDTDAEIEEEIEEEVVDEEPEPKVHHKLERIEMSRPTVKKGVHKPAVKKEEGEPKPKRRLFTGIRKKA